MTTNHPVPRIAARSSIVALGAITALGFAACSGDSPGGMTAPSDATTPGSVNGWPAAIAAGVEAAADAAADAPATDDGPMDVCALLPSADVSAAFDVAFDQGTPTHHEDIGGDQCVWNGLDPMSIDIVSLSVQRDEDLPAEWRENGMDAAALFQEQRKMTPDAVEIPLGDEAYSAGSTVHVFHDDTIYDFNTVGDSPAAIAALQALATSAMQTMAI